jgi:integrase
MSIYRRKGSPHWWINISVAGRKTRRTTGTEDRGKAEEFEAAERERLWRLHKLGDRGALRWAEAAAQWLNEVPEKSRAKEESILRWFDQYLADEQIGAIDRDAVLELRAMLLEEGKSRARTDRYLAILRAVLRLAVTNGHLSAAPAVPMFNASAAAVRWLTGSQLEKLCTNLPPHLSLCARFAVHSGLRMRSMLSLTWDRIDLKAKRLWIPGEQMKGGQPHGYPITKKMAELLREARAMNPTGAHVFQYNGKPVDDCNTRAFQKAAKAAGLEGLRWHDLRHTFAAWAVQEGVSLPELMELGGWKSHTMVMRYAHLSPDHLAKAAERIARYGHRRR